MQSNVSCCVKEVIEAEREGVLLKFTPKINGPTNLLGVNEALELLIMYMYYTGMRLFRLLAEFTLFMSAW